MAGKQITIISRCGHCGSELRSFEVAPENMMLIAREPIWCPKCNDYAPEVRGVAGRLDSIDKEKSTYPPSLYWPYVPGEAGGTPPPVAS